MCRTRAIVTLVSRLRPGVPSRAAGAWVCRARIHGYDDVDREVVTDILSDHLGDLDAFVAAVPRRQQDVAE